MDFRHAKDTWAGHRIRAEGEGENLDFGRKKAQKAQK